MPYGPELKYPFKDKCKTCDADVWVHYSTRKGTEYKTLNKSWGLSEETQKPLFHSCKKEGVKEVMQTKLDPVDPYLKQAQNVSRILANIHNVLVAIQNTLEDLKDQG